MTPLPNALKPVENPWNGTCVRPECPNQAVRREVVCFDHLPPPVQENALATIGDLALRIVEFRKKRPNYRAKRIAETVGCSIAHVYAIAAEYGFPFGQSHAPIKQPA